MEHLEGILAEFREAIVICDLYGKILLFNPQSKKLFRNTPTLDLRLSFYGVCHKTPIDHAIKSLLQRYADKDQFRFGKQETQTQLICATVKETTLLNCHIRLIPATPLAESVFIFTFTPIPDLIEETGQKGSQLTAMIEDLRGPLANLNAAAENLKNNPSMPSEERIEFENVIASESSDLVGRFESVVNLARALTYTQWPLADIYSSDMLKCVIHELRKKSGMKVTITGSPLWLHADSHSMMLVLECLILELQKVCKVSEIDINLQAGERSVYLDIVWNGSPILQNIIDPWLEMLLPDTTQGITIADVLQRHCSDIWSQQHHRDGYAILRIPLPNSRIHGLDSGKILPERPEFFDPVVDMEPQLSQEVLNRPLLTLSYVVFDTETTGLCPEDGDEVISIAGVRIEKGRILADEIYESLINPKCSIPKSSVEFHGITKDEVRGKPPISVVLPEFNSFVDDAVLVAHNAAFDMKFIKQKEKTTGVEFTNPILDTLILSHVVDGEAKDYSLAAVCRRMGVQMKGRYTALGDSFITAQVFTALLDKLKAKGITSLGQAIAASHQVLASRRKAVK